MKNDQYLVKSFHNIEFDKNTSSDYFDWKVTTIFYTALHYMKHYTEQQNVVLRNHSHIFENINPNNSDGVIPLQPKAFTAYKLLYDLSIKSRYEGINNKNLFLKTNSNNYKKSLEFLNTIKQELINQGLEIE
ncbi:MAG TPA: hypothetical protein PLE30_09795 [Candidatus Kapabacteria bacterium]|nr:hypothetical protein [Candidatus Kapabacteria bacterium]